MPPPKKKKKKKKLGAKKNCQKSKISQFFYTTLVDTLPRNMHDFFFGVTLLRTFRQMSFEVYSPIGPLLTKTKKNGKNPKFKISPIFIQLLVETLPRRMHFLKWICYVFFWGRCCLKFFLPCGPMFTKTKTIRKQWSGNMVKRYLSTKFHLSTKFCVNLLCAFW